MKALILLATLKKDKLSHTETLSEFFSEYLVNENIETKIIKLVDYNILPGTYFDMGEGDQWKQILNHILEADILIFATPVWWGNQSSEMQKVIERLDQVHDEIMEGKPSILSGKAGGIIITGGSDGAQHIIGNISNFFNALGVLIPPFATLSVLWDGHQKSAEKSREELLEKYRKDYSDSANKMVRQLLKYASNKNETG